MKLNPPYDMDDLTDYWRDESFRGIVEDFTHVGKVSKDGTDYIDLYLKVEGGIITAAKYMAEGSVLSMGLTAVLCDMVIGKSTMEALRRCNPINFVAQQIPPGRIKCASLPHIALQLALDGQKDSKDAKRAGT